VRILQNKLLNLYQCYKQFFSEVGLCTSHIPRSLLTNRPMRVVRHVHDLFLRAAAWLGQVWQGFSSFGYAAPKLAKLDQSHSSFSASFATRHVTSLPKQEHTTSVLKLLYVGQHSEFIFELELLC
jgi:hypothetical protein